MSFRIVDECTDERVRDQVGHDALGQWRAVVQRVAVASDVDDDFSRDAAATVVEKVTQRVGVLLGSRRPRLIGLEPCGQRSPEFGGGRRPGDGQQFGLVLGCGEPGERSDLGVGDCTFGERFGD